MRLQSFNVNWFDLVVAVMCVVGIIRGRKHGMSMEVLPLMQWLVIIILGAYTYEALGKALQNVCDLSLGFCYIIAYLFEAVVVAWTFNVMKHAVGDKLVTADAFGKGEYYYGMAAGVLRYFAMLMMALSLLSVMRGSGAAPAPPPPASRTPRESPGPLDGFTISSVQQDVFVKSRTGPFLKKYFSNLLMKTPAAAQAPQRETLGRQRERLLDEVSGSGRK